MTVTLPWGTSKDAPTKSVAAMIEPHIDHAGDWASDLVKSATDVGTAIASSGRKAVHDLGDNAESLGTDLRHLRFTSEPKPTDRGLMAVVALLAGFAAGAALVYFLGPEHVRARLCGLRDRISGRSRTEDAPAQQTETELHGQMLNASTNGSASGTRTEHPHPEALAHTETLAVDTH